MAMEKFTTMIEHTGMMANVSVMYRFRWLEPSYYFMYVP